MEHTSFSVRAVLKEAYKIAEDNLWPVVGTCAILLVGAIVVSALASDNELLSFIASSVFSIAFVLFGLAYAFDRTFSLDSVIESLTFKVFVRYVLASVAVMLVTLVGLVFLIVPGVIAMVMFLFTPYLILDAGMNPLEAMRESRKITKGYRGKLFLLVLATLGINILGVIAFGIGLLFTIPLTLIAFSLVYKKLSHTQTVEASLPQA